MRIRDDDDAPCGRRVAGTGVVVPAHQRDRERPMRVAPTRERGIERSDPSGRRVQEIAEDHEPRRLRAFDERREAREIVRRRTARNRYAARAQCRRLAEMHVRDEQRLLARPEERTLGEQFDTLAAERRHQRARRGRGAVRGEQRGGGGGHVAVAAAGVARAASAGHTRRSRL
jgi:hypothetical protein